MHIHAHVLRSSTSTKDFPLDNFKEAMQVFLLLSKRRILCSLVLKSHQREILTWTRVLRTGCHAGERPFLGTVSFTSPEVLYTLFTSRNFEALLFWDQWLHFSDMYYNISYLLASLLKRGRIKFSIRGDRELHKGWVTCPGLQVNQWQGQNKVPWLRGTCCQHKAMPPSSCTPWSHA